MKVTVLINKEMEIEIDDKWWGCHGVEHYSKQYDALKKEIQKQINLPFSCDEVVDPKEGMIDGVYYGYNSRVLYEY